MRTSATRPREHERVLTMKRFVIAVGFASVVAVIAVGCGGGGGSSGGSSVSLVTTVPPSTQAYIGQYRAADLFGPKFGLPSKNKVTGFEDENTATQVLLSGGADVEGGAVTQVIQLNEHGQDVRAFCPVQKDSTEQLVGRTDKITSLDQITDPDVRVAVDSPGGLVNFIMNLVFREKNLGITVKDLQNVTVLGDGSQRLAALAANQVDVGSVDLFELPDLIKQIGPKAVTTLSVTAADSDFLADVYFAPKKWLDENTELAGRFCAATLYSNRALAASFDQYKAAINKYVKGGADEATLKKNWAFSRKYQVWPYNTDVMSPQSIKTIIDVGVPSGLLDAKARQYTFGDIVDTRPGEIAMDLVGGPVTAAAINAGNVPAPKGN
jgi:ABC-type nitrate/sulfonate/bicarbonate transport system substrate-binding protein